ncbi:hypothetical protein [Streptomyces sp. CA-253872]|uniref:hypothetical protein n=1 Tax=Streptomyces sp. CA-253872 TaxID=3240067 RepID=UPI003D923D55
MPGFTRGVTTCCLVVLVLPVVLLGWFWFSLWHDGHVNERRERAAEASVLRLASRAARDTRRALAGSGPTGPEAVTGVLWRHTKAPVITYDAPHGTYTAARSWAVTYDRKGFLSAGPTQVEWCFTLVAHHAPGTGWTTRLTKRTRADCLASRLVDRDVVRARDVLASLPDELLTRAGVSRELAARGGQGQDVFTVRKVARERDRVSVTVRVRAGAGSDGPVARQCYRFTRPLARGEAPVAEPLARC